MDAVLFDMDGLLLDSERIWREVFFDETPPRPGREAFYPRLIGHRRATNLRQLAEWLGDMAEAEALFARWERAGAARIAQGIPAKPGALALITHLHGQGIPMAVVTSSRRAHALQHLEQAGILPRLTALVGGDEVTDAKPHPEPYLTGAALLGIAPERCAAFEDSPTGVRAAVAAGCRVVQVPDQIPGDPSLGAHVAQDLIAGARHVGLIGPADLGDAVCT